MPTLPQPHLVGSDVAMPVQNTKCERVLLNYLETMILSVVSVPCCYLLTPLSLTPHVRRATAAGWAGGPGLELACSGATPG